MKEIDYMMKSYVDAVNRVGKELETSTVAQAFNIGWNAACKAAAAKVNAENAALRMALNDAISSPMGVVPASAEQFYDATKGMVKA